MYCEHTEADFDCTQKRHICWAEANELAVIAGTPVHRYGGHAQHHVCPSSHAGSTSQFCNENMQVSCLTALVGNIKSHIPERSTSRNIRTLNGSNEEDGMLAFCVTPVSQPTTCPSHGLPSQCLLGPGECSLLKSASHWQHHCGGSWFVHAKGLFSNTTVIDPRPVAAHSCG